MKECIIATYNIQFAINRAKVIENIKEMAKRGVTIFCLQEIINTPNEKFMVDEILNHLGDNWKAFYHVGTENSRLSIGTAIVWNADIFTLRRTEKILLPKIKKFDLHEHFYYKVIGVPGIPIQRRATVCDFSINQTILRVVSIHLDNVGGPIHRLRQFSYLLSKLDTLPKVSHEFLCGDFNTFDLLQTNYEKKLLQKKLGNAFIDASKNIDWTSDLYLINFQTSIKIFPWFVKKFNIHVRRRLDYIWTKGSRILVCKKLNLSGSDHLPIIAKLKI